MVVCLPEARGCEDKCRNGKRKYAGKLGMTAINIRRRQLLSTSKEYLISSSSVTRSGVYSGNCVRIFMESGKTQG